MKKFKSNYWTKEEDMNLAKFMINELINGVPAKQACEKYVDLNLTDRTICAVNFRWKNTINVKYKYEIKHFVKNYVN